MIARQPHPRGHKPTVEPAEPRGSSPENAPGPLDGGARLVWVFVLAVNGVLWALFLVALWAMWKVLVNAPAPVVAP